MNHVKFAVAFSLIAGLLASSNAVVSADELPIEVHGRVERWQSIGAVPPQDCPGVPCRSSHSQTETLVMELR